MSNRDERGDIGGGNNLEGRSNNSRRGPNDSSDTIVVGSNTGSAVKLSNKQFMNWIGDTDGNGPSSPQKKPLLGRGGGQMVSVADHTYDYDDGFIGNNGQPWDQYGNGMGIGMNSGEYGSMPFSRQKSYDGDDEINRMADWAPPSNVMAPHPFNAGGYQNQYDQQQYYNVPPQPLQSSHPFYSSQLPPPPPPPPPRPKPGSLGVYQSLSTSPKMVGQHPLLNQPSSGGMTSPSTRPPLASGHQQSYNHRRVRSYTKGDSPVNSPSYLQRKFEYPTSSAINRVQHYYNDNNDDILTLSDDENDVQPDHDFSSLWKQQEQQKPPHDSDGYNRYNTDVENFPPTIDGRQRNRQRSNSDDRIIASSLLPPPSSSSSSRKGGQSATGYGAINSPSNIANKNPAATSGSSAGIKKKHRRKTSFSKELEQPPANSPASLGRARKNSTLSSDGKIKPILRSSSIGDLRQKLQPKQQLTQSQPPPKSGSSSNKRSHRRTNSDSLALLLGRPSHRRAASDGLPPVGPKGNRLLPKNFRYPPNPRAPLRNRALSETSSIVSYASIASTAGGSIVSDITKSALFGGFTESGMIKLHFPIENVHLMMNDDLESGIMYKHNPCDEQEKFEEYHKQTTEGNNNWELDNMNESNNNNDATDCLACTCTCNACNACNNKKYGLPPARYVLTVDKDIYKRVLSEISDSKGMPCGLYFCGHHSDVDNPSIFIAVIIVLLLFTSMFIVAIL